MNAFQRTTKKNIQNPIVLELDKAESNITDTWVNKTNVIRDPHTFLGITSTKCTLKRESFLGILDFSLVFSVLHALAWILSFFFKPNRFCFYPNQFLKRIDKIR